MKTAMSKRAEEAGLKAYPVVIEEHTERDLNKPKRLSYINGYEQAEKDTIERALDWLKARTNSYVGPIEEPFWTMFIEHFKKAMEE